MADTRGTFRLKNVRQDILNDEYVPIPNVWTLESLDDAGYIAGGEIGPGPHISRYDKIAYSTDTKSTLTDYMYTARRGGGGSSSPTAGYLMGGFAPSVPNGPYSSSVDKLTYATQTTALVPSNFADSSTFGSAGGGSTTAGYLLQGGNPMVSYVRKITYATDAISLLPARVPNPRGANTNAGSSGNGDNFLYIMGGSDGAGSEVKKLTYSNDSVSSMPNMPTPGNLNRLQKPGCSSSDVAAYLCGGSNPYNSRIDKITFSNDTCTYVTNSSVPTPAGRMKVAGTGLPSAGYFSGGTNTSITEKITMSTESCSRIPALDLTAPGINQGTAFGAKGDNHPAPVPLRWVDDEPETNNNAYTGGGTGPSPGNARNQITKFDFSTDTAQDISPSSTLSSARYNVGAVSSPSAGYWMGGSNGYGMFSRVDKLTYATDSVAYTPGANLSGTRYGSYCTGNTTKGYSGGCNTNGDGVGSVMDRLTYATDTTTRLPGSNLNTTRIRCGSAGSQDVGYWMGSAFERSSTDKMTYSTESVAIVPSAQLPTKRGSMGACASATDVYTAGGRQSPGDAKTSQILKLNLSSEAIGIDASLSSVRYGVSGTGNSTKGYFIGGTAGNAFPGGAKTNVDKFIYSTSTVSTFTQPNVSWESGSMARRENSLPAVDAPTATPTASTTQTGAAERGYIFGGNPGPLDTIDKLDMSTETISSTGSTLEEDNKRMVCFGNTTTAYATGSTSPVRSWIQKFVYSTDVRTKLPATLQSARGYMGGISNNTIGYTMGGASGNKKQMDKFVMATETNSAIPDMPSARYRNCTWGSDTTGYTGSGYPSPGMQTVNKITYSNDTQSNTTNLSRTTTLAAGVSNATIGYIVGGEQSKTAVDKWTMSSDSCSRVPGANLPASRYAWEQANNTPTKGYFVGGAPGSNSDTFVLTFSSDSAALSPTCFVSTPSRSGAGAAGPNQRGNAGSNLQPNII